MELVEITMWPLWTALILAAAGLITGLARRKSPAGVELLFAMLASIAFAICAWQLTHGSYVFTFLTFIYLYMVLGTRWNAWIRENYRFTRLAYWVIADIIPVATFLLGYAIWPGNWIFYVAWVIVAVIVSSLVTLVLMSVFPIVGRQEFIRMLPPKDARRLEHEREIARLEAENLRRKGLALLSLHTQQIDRATQEVEQGRFADAVARMQPVQTMLEKISTLIPEQRRLLGRICLLHARMAISGRQFDQADAWVRKARPFVPPDLGIIAALAENAARSNNRKADNLAYCLEFLAMRRGRPMDAVTQVVSEFLQRLCALEESSSQTAANEAQALAEKVTSADPGLSWPDATIGTALVLKGQPAEGARYLERFLARDASQWSAHYFMGLAQFQLKAMLRSYKALAESLRLNPDQTTGAAHLLGGLLLDAHLSGSSLTGSAKSDLEQAIEWLQHAVKQNPKNAQAHFDLARAHQLKGQNQKARQSVERALKLDSKLFAAHLMLANILYQEADWPAALAHFNQVPASQRQDAQLDIKIGHCLLETQAYQPAIDLLQPLETQHPQAAMLVGRAYLRLRQFKQAVERLSVLATGPNPTPETCYYLGCALAWLGKEGETSAFRHAMRWLEQAEEMNDLSYSTRASLQLGHIYMLRERSSEAIPAYRKAYASSGLRLQAGLGLVKAYLLENADQKALEVLAELVSAYSNETSVHYLQGMVFERQKKMPEAEAAYRKAKATGALAIILFLRGEVPQAITLFKQARQEGLEHDRLLYFSGLAAATQQDYAGAIAEWQLLAKRYPDDVHLRLNIARSWYLAGCETYRQGDYVKTADAWEQFYQVYHVDDQTRHNLGSVYLLHARQMMGKSDAESALRRARELNMDPKICDAIEGLHRLLSDDKSGADLLRKVAQKQPDNPQVLYNLGMAEIRAGNSQAALPYLTQAYECATGELREQVTWALASAHGNLSNWSKAAELVSDVVAR
jgi:tetratricopeptide (TPR) repeat protein